jgi:hypothetical protein
VRFRELTANTNIAAVAVAVTAGLVSHDGRASSLRDGQRPHAEKRVRAPQPQSVSLAWVGDISLSSHYGLPPSGGRSLLRDVKRYLRSSDLTIGNLEGTLGSGGAPKCGTGAKNCFVFQAPASYARVIRQAGFDVMNTANNHAFDFGKSGQQQTLAALKRAHLGHTGRPGEILTRRVRGLRLAFVGFAPYPWAASLRDLGEARRLVRRARRKADVVVVTMHAGAEGADKIHTPPGTEIAFGENRGNTRAFAHAVVQAGADLVLGSGPHVVRGLEKYRGRLIAYSLGNFLGYHTLSTGGVLSESGLLRIRVDSSGAPVRGRWVSLRLDAAGVPHPERGRRSARIVRQLSHQDFGRRAYPMNIRGELKSARRVR